MTTLDFVLLAIVAACAILGFVKGFVLRIGSLVGVVLGVILALKYGTAAGEYLKPLISSDPVRGILGPFLVFLVTYLGLALISNSVHKLVHMARLGCLNRLAGALVGVATAAIPLGVALLLAAAYIPPARPPIAKSQVAVHLMKGAQTLIALVPEQFKEAFEQGKDEVEKLIDRYKGKLQELPKEVVGEVEV
jgi:membrane protein required for colicin V production